MAHNDDLLSTIFPTRDGEAKGAAAERKMLDKAGGAETIRTVILTPGDGSETRLRTRGGAPDFVTTKPGVTVTNALRGFVMKGLTTVAVLFNAVTLAVRKTKFPLYNLSYSVVPMKTRLNAAANKGWGWRDVVVFMGSKLYINAGTSKGGLVAGSIPNDAVYLPVVLPDPAAAASTPYLNGALFGVSRTQVNKLTGTGTTYTVSPLNPQAFGEPWRSGPAVSQSDHAAVAWLSQLWWVGTDGWDANDSDWVGKWFRYDLSYGSPYVTPTAGVIGIDAPSCFPQDDGPTTGQTILAFDAPGASCGYLGVFSITSTEEAFGSVSVIRMSPGIVGTYSVPTHALRITDWSKRSFSNSINTTVDVGSLTATISATTALYRDTNTEQVTTIGSTEATGAVNTGGNRYGFTVTTTGSGALLEVAPYDASHDEPYGTTSIAAGGSGASTSAYYENTHQETETSITVGALPLVTVSLSFDKIPGGGEQINIIPKTLDIPVDPYTYAEFNKIVIETEVRDFPGDGSYTYNNTTHYALCEPHLYAIAATLAGVNLYYPGGFDNGAVGSNRHYYTKTARQPEFSSDLHWETRDYLLFDDVEGAYVYVKGVFEGGQNYTGTATNAVATLTVTLQIETRSGSAETELYKTNFEFPELFLLKEIIPGVEYAETPKQRVMFFPMYRHQGNFRGVAYTTAAEESEGAAPACLMNFRLNLTGYDGVDGVLPDINNAVYFIPLNLHEMLYAYVYSNSGGQDETYRYPIYYPDYKTRIESSLFSTTWHIGFKNGVLTTWETDPTSELFRT